MRLLSLTTILILFAGLGQACAMSVSSDVTRTGPLRAALPPGAPVKVFLLGKPKVPYVEVGFVEVSNGSTSERITSARAAARRLGGNVIVSMNQRSGVATSSGFGEPGNTFSYPIQSFAILYIASNAHPHPAQRARQRPRPEPRPRESAPDMRW